MFSPGKMLVRGLAGSPPSRLRSPGYAEVWKPLRLAWRGRRWPWRLWEKCESSWSTSPRARNTSHRTGKIGGHVSGADRCGYAYEGCCCFGGCPWATATRKSRTPMTPARRSPRNRLTDVERARVLEVVNSKRFIDLAPIQIFAQLLNEGTYLYSISTFYRIPEENA